MASEQKSAEHVWNEAMAAAAKALHDAREYGGAYGQQERRPSNFGRAADWLNKVPNPYRGGDITTGVPPRQSQEWHELCKAASEMGEAVARFQNARDAYTTKYPITNR